METTIGHLSMEETAMVTHHVPAIGRNTDVLRNHT